MPICGVSQGDVQISKYTKVYINCMIYTDQTVRKYSMHVIKMYAYGVIPFFLEITQDL